MTAPMERLRLRIAVLNRTFSPTAGGAERYSIALVEQLAERHEIHVFAQTIEHYWPGVTYHRISMPMRKPRWVNQLWFATTTWWATRKGFDVVHSHENTWHGDVQTVHVLPIKHNLFVGREGWSRFFRWVKVATSPRLLTYLCLERTRYASREGRAVVVISPSLKKFFGEAYPQALPMVSLITPGIELPSAPATPTERHDARQLLGLPQGSQCILFVGNDFRKKGLASLFQAVALLPENVVLAVVGSSQQLPQFRREAEFASVQSRVFFLGSLVDISIAYRAADCLAHPTLEDTFAMVVLEAMASGLPVVVSGVAYCGVSGLLQHEVNALILEHPQDANALAVLLKRILEERELKESLGKQARIFAEQFEWSGIAAKQEKLYWSVKASKGL